MAMSERERLLTEDYNHKLSQIRNEQKNCNHQWGETKYDAEIKKEPIYITKFQGVDSYGEIVGYSEKSVNRWSRTCSKCGLIEYTYEQKPVKYEPKF